MKKLAAAFIAAFFMSGCTNYLAKIPNGEFESFEYHRAGNITSSDIVATGAKKSDDGVVIEELIIKTDYGPLWNANVRIKGYKRESDSRGF